MIVREVMREDFSALLALYTHLHDNEMPVMTQTLKQIWEKIISDENHHILVACADDKIVSSCVLVIIPNLTHEQRPYALIENVITHPEYRKQGYASRVLQRAKEIAYSNHCYKMMLMTGSKEDDTLRFYEQAGYNRKDKMAFIQWLD